MKTQTFNLSDMWSRHNDGEFTEGALGLVLAGLPAVAKDGPWLAGGALRRTLIGDPLASDFDYFFRDADQLLAFAAQLEALGLVKVRETEHHMEFRGYLKSATREVEVQCIRFQYYTDAAAVIDSFDYTACQFAYDGETLTCGEFALWDLGRRKLVVHKLTYPVASMRRLIKYTKQGFTACGGCLSAILRETASSPELLSQLDIQYVD